MSSFPTTHWHFMTQLRDARGGTREQMVGSFLVRYLSPMRSYLGYRFPTLSEADLDDLMQSFIADRVIQRSLLDHARENRGSLRRFLRVCLMNFANTWLAREARVGALHVSVADLDTSGGGGHGDGCCRFDEAWARHVIDQGVGRLRDECEASGRPLVWTVFEARLLRPLRSSEKPVPYDELAARLGVESKQLANMLTTAKGKLRGHFMDLIGDYAQDGDQVQSEIHDLFRVLAAS